MNKPIRIKLHVITPIHIDCDEVYESISFLIDDKKLLSFDKMDFISCLDMKGRNDLSKICDKGTLESIIELYKFYDNRKDTIKKLNNNHIVEISENIIDQYNKLKTYKGDKLIKEFNQFQIYRTSYSLHDNMPYIPGSSLKGSLRTAYLNNLAQKPDHSNRKNNNAKELEKELLQGSFDTDPFRMIKVSDLQPFETVTTTICYAVDIKKKSGMNARGPYQILETIEPNSVFEGAINISKPLNEIKKPIEKVEDLLNACHNFYYEKILDDDIKNMNESNKYDINFKKEIDAKKDNMYLVRIGRHSGAEAVTIQGHRSIKIKIKEGKDEYRDHTTTFWFTSDIPRPADNNNLKPFGWAMIEVLEDGVNSIYTVRQERETNSADYNNVRAGLVPALNRVTTRVTPTKPVPIKWEKAYVNWNPGDRILTATNKDEKKAYKKLEKEKESFVPEAHRDKLFNKPKNKIITVFVEKDGNSFKLIKLEE